MSDPVADDDPGELRRKVEALEAELRRKGAQIERLRAVVAAQQHTIARIEGTFVWQTAVKARYVRDRWIGREGALRRLFDATSRRITRVARPLLRIQPPPATPYHDWLAVNWVGPAELRGLAERVAAANRQPLFSVVVPVHDVAEPWLRSCVESVRTQAWPRWELCAVDDGSKAPHVAPMLEAYAREDPRIRMARLAPSQGIVAATRRALELASGDFVAFLDHDDELAPEALLAVAALLADQPDLDVVYSDEDKLDPDGRRVDPFFKPDWSPDLFLSMNYLNHLTVVRRALLEEVGGLRAGFDGSQDYDLLLRLTERTNRVGHVPRVLYHWRQVAGSEAAVRGAKPYAYEAARRALEEALSRRGVEGRVESDVAGLYHVRRAIQGRPLVSIVMPTRDQARVLRTCIESIEHLTDWPCWELVVVDNGSTEPEAREYLEQIARRHRVIRDERPFNWSALNNAAARQARGEHLLFMNNDMEIVTADWMRALLEHAQRSEVGAVGARLLYPDDTIQHAGIALGIGGVAGHVFKRLPVGEPGYFSLPRVVRDVSAVTGACLMTRARVFEEMGGFDERLAVAFNDVDYCIRLRQASYLVVYTPLATLYHHESVSRGEGHPPEDEELIKTRWAGVLQHDPYYNPNLSLDRVDYALRAPARKR